LNKRLYLWLVKDMDIFPMGQQRPLLALQIDQVWVLNTWGKTQA
jgi:hypothetical protein